MITKKTLVQIIANAALFLGSILFSIFLSLFILWAYSRIVMHAEPVHLFTPRPLLWESHQSVAYRNKPNNKRYALHKIRGHTESNGFRREEDVSQIKPQGLFRIFAMGDSVTWGTRVNLEDTFSAQLEGLLNKGSVSVEVINSGVVGYSTLQSMYFLECCIQSFSPNLVLLNYCDNDWFPSEDPFENASEIHKRWVTEVNSRIPELPKAEIAILDAILETRDLWQVFHNTKQHPELGPAMRRVLIERPMQRMHSLLKSQNSELLVLFIPDTFPDEFQTRTRQAIMAFLKEEGIPFLDLAPLLSEDTTRFPRAHRDLQSDYGYRTLLDLRVDKFLDRIGLSFLDPAIALKRIALSREVPDSFDDMEAHHQNYNFVDSVGHLSKRGHRIVAEATADYLRKHSFE